ncbi:hypothetical protein LEN26_007316 [Aphanomyces euteiches]|nr:hypothetical protein AeMF1_009303 [Aphanomyces euteiches]KAH9132701.1 hypothetical protein LEN26_007316 [Aphanomyces euteiches]KAH9196368.1 hypothetical protein AeNC1_001663 [Aphanomyces euteiches]
MSAFTSPLAKKQKLRTHSTPEAHSTPLSGRKNGFGHDEMKTATVLRIRGMVQTCLATNQPQSAMFYANKLATITQEPADYILLARSYYATGDYHRAIHTLKRLTKDDRKGQTPKINNTPRRHSRRLSQGVMNLPDDNILLSAYFLLGQAMTAIKQWEDCQDMLESILTDNEDQVIRKARAYHQNNSTHINVVSSLCCLRGEVCEALESRERAAYWYALALRCDVHCCEAFMHLVEKHMLTSVQERTLFESLSFTSPEDEYLKCFYASQLGRYDPSPSIPEKFHAVESTHGLLGNPDVLVAKAEAYYYQLDTEHAYSICRGLRESDPCDYKYIPVYVSTLVQLEKKSELFHFAHQMVGTYPKKAAAWYAVGCYYFLLENFEAAQRYFHKATHLEPHFAPAWIGFGHAFAVQDESDQAMASYRTASRLFLGCHLPLLCIGMEHYRVNNLSPALQFVSQARTVCPTDPLVYNEMGAIYFRQHNYVAAIEMFSKAIALCRHMSHTLLVAWEATFFNMAQAHRKIKQYDTAILYYQEALALCPTKASTHFALAFTYHMQGNLKDAIQSYHTALSFDPEDPVASQMLDTALQEMFSSVHLPEEEETKQEDEEDDVLDVSLNMDISVESVDL